MLKAVLFDMDGLMFDTERLGVDAWKRIYKENGIDVPEELLLSGIGTDGKKTARLYRERLGEAYERMDRKLAVQQRVQYANDYIREHGMPVKPGLMELLSYLKGNGVKMAVATSTERSRAEHYLRSGGVLGLFDAIVCGDMVRLGKPEPEIFLTALSLLGEKAGDSLVLEDSGHGVLAAHRAGIRVVVVPDLVRPDDDTKRLAYAICHSLHDVRKLLEEGGCDLKEKFA